MSQAILLAPEASGLPPGQDINETPVQIGETPYLHHPALLVPVELKASLNGTEKGHRNNARVDAVTAIQRAYREDPEVVAMLREYELPPLQRAKPDRGRPLHDLETLAAGYRRLKGGKEEELYPLLYTIETGLETYVRLGTTTKDASEADGLAMKQLAAATSILLHTNLRLPLDLVRTHYGARFSRDPFFEDIAMAGIDALDRAGRLFDHREGNEFSTFAVRVIERATVRYVTDHARVVRLPVPVDDKHKKVLAAVDKLTPVLHHDPAPAEIAATINMEEAEVAELQELGKNIKPASLEEGKDRLNVPLRATVADPRETYAHQRNAELNELNEALDRELDRQLSPAEMVIISLRFGIYNEAIGAHYPSLPYDKLFKEAVAHASHGSNASPEQGRMGYKRLAEVLTQIPKKIITINKVKAMESEAMAKLATSEALAQVARHGDLEYSL
jgi:RNA polymerase sigma factor (sigma-70 family)